MPNFNVPPPPPLPPSIGEIIGRALSAAATGKLQADADALQRHQLEEELALRKEAEARAKRAEARQEKEQVFNQTKTVYDLLHGTPGTQPYDPVNAPKTLDAIANMGQFASPNPDVEALQKFLSGIGVVPPPSGLPRVNPEQYMSIPQGPAQTGFARDLEGVLNPPPLKMVHPEIRFPLLDGGFIAKRPPTGVDVTDQKAAEGAATLALREKQIQIEEAAREAARRKARLENPDPEDIPRILSPQELALARPAIELKLLDPTKPYTTKQFDKILSQANVQGDNAARDKAAAASLAQARAAMEARKDEKAAAYADKVYTRYEKDLEELKKPWRDRLDRAQRFVDTLDPANYAGDSVVAPEFIVAMAGGYGSGVRLTQAEIDNVTKSRTVWDSLWATAQKVRAHSKDENGEPATFSPEQREMMRELIVQIHQHFKERVDLANDARDALIDNYNSPAKAKIIFSKFDKKLDLSYELPPDPHKAKSKDDPSAGKTSSGVGYQIIKR